MVIAGRESAIKAGSLTLTWQTLIRNFFIKVLSPRLPSALDMNNFPGYKLLEFYTLHNAYSSTCHKVAPPQSDY